MAEPRARSLIASRTIENRLRQMEAHETVRTAQEAPAHIAVPVIHLDIIHYPQGARLPVPARWAGTGRS